MKLEYQPGAIVPERVAARHESNVTTRRISLLHYLVVGKDNRLSTSKTIAFLWTLTIAFALVALLAARLLGDSTGWDALVYGGLDEEYLLFLGGPYAAAVLAKYKAVTADGASAKTIAAPGEASGRDVISDDRGDGDLVDFQYVLFNLIAIAYVLGGLIPNLREGMPDMPGLLAGLTLTSAAGYSAKKLVAQERPRLISIHPSTMPAAKPATFSVWCRHVVVPGSVTGDGKPQLPLVSVGAAEATVSGVEETLGSERLTITVAGGLAPGEHLVRVSRADGVPAVSEAGIDALTLTVTPAQAAPPGG